jgi:negative regulator of PHO system
MNNEFCSSFYKIGLLYEYYRKDLKKEVSDRKAANALFREDELLYLFHSLASVVSYLKQKTVVHGDIRPYNVLINNHGQVKLGEVYI